MSRGGDRISAWDTGTTTWAPLARRGRRPAFQRHRHARERDGGHLFLEASGSCYTRQRAPCTLRRLPALAFPAALHGYCRPDQAGGVFFLLAGTAERPMRRDTRFPKAVAVLPPIHRTAQYRQWTGAPPPDSGPLAREIDEGLAAARATPATGPAVLCDTCHGGRRKWSSYSP